MMSIRPAAFCALGLLFLATACSSSSPTPAPTPATVVEVTRSAVAPPLVPDAVSPAPAQPSPGCTAPTPAPSGTALETITVGGAERTYRRYLPEGAVAGPRPLVIDLHGLTSNIGQEVAITAFEALAAQEQFIVLTPQGGGTPSHWDLTNRGDNTDVAFIDAMLQEVEAASCVDAARVYSTGISDGGIMSALLGCLRADRIAAVGLVSGITHPDGCQPARPVPMMVFWGDKDVVLPFCGGLGPIVSSLIANKPLTADASNAVCPPAQFNGFPPVEDVVAAWAATDGCDPAPSVLPVTAAIEQRVFGSCTQDAALRFYIIAGGGHTWPGSKLMQALSATSVASVIGFTTGDVDATKLIWAFFRGYALPPR